MWSGQWQTVAFNKICINLYSSISQEQKIWYFTLLSLLWGSGFRNKSSHLELYASVIWRLFKIFFILQKSATCWSLLVDLFTVLSFLNCQRFFLRRCAYFGIQPSNILHDLILIYIFFVILEFQNASL